MANRAPYQHRVKDQFGDAVYLASVYIYTDSGRTSAATLYDAATGGSTVSQPLATDTDGKTARVFLAPGTYYTKVTDTSGTAQINGSATSFANDLDDTVDVLPAGDDIVQLSIVTAKGDLIVGTASGTVARVGVGAEGQVLTVVGANTAGVGWTTAAGVAGGVPSDHTHTSVAGQGGNSLDLSGAGGVLRLPQAAAPAQTAEGSAVWDTDDDVLTIGTGAGRKTLLNKDTLTTKGDIYIATGAGVIVRLPIGADGTYFKADSTQAEGVAWAAGQSAHTIKDGGSAMTARTNMDFQDGFVLTDNAGSNTTELDLDYASTADLADIAAAEAAGSGTIVPRGDHVHAHGTGYLPNAHHNQAHDFTTGGDHTGTAYAHPIQTTTAQGNVALSTTYATVATYTIPANSIAAGTTYRIKLLGTVSLTAQKLYLRAQYNSGTIATEDLTASLSVSTGIDADLWVGFRSTSVSVASMIWRESGGGSSRQSGIVVTTALTTTADADLTIQAKVDSGTATFSREWVTVQVVKP